VPGKSEGAEGKEKGNCVAVRGRGEEAQSESAGR